jgi:hypothetical protein
MSKYEEERNTNYDKGIQHTLKLTTRVPSKYRVIDLETGDIWKVVLQPNGQLRWYSAQDISYEEKE